MSLFATKEFKFNIVAKEMLNNPSTLEERFSELGFHERRKVLRLFELSNKELFCRALLPMMDAALQTDDATLRHAMYKAMQVGVNREFVTADVAVKYVKRGFDEAMMGGIMAEEFADFCLKKPGFLTSAQVAEISTAGQEEGVYRSVKHWASNLTQG